MADRRKGKGASRTPRQTRAGKRPPAASEPAESPPEQGQAPAQRSIVISIVEEQQFVVNYAGVTQLEAPTLLRKAARKVERDLDAIE